MQSLLHLNPCTVPRELICRPSERLGLIAALEVNGHTVKIFSFHSLKTGKGKLPALGNSVVGSMSEVQLFLCGSFMSAALKEKQAARSSCGTWKPA